MLWVCLLLLCSAVQLGAASQEQYERPPVCGSASDCILLYSFFWQPLRDCMPVHIQYETHYTSRCPVTSLSCRAGGSHEEGCTGPARPSQALPQRRRGLIPRRRHDLLC